MSHTALPQSMSSTSLAHQQLRLHQAAPPALRPAAPRARTHRRVACASSKPTPAPTCSSEASSSSTGRRALLLAAPSIAWAVTELGAPAQSLASPERAPLEVIQKDYDSYAPSYDDWAAKSLGYDNLRKQLLDQASGDVIEMGIGTGYNFKYYDYFDKVRSVLGIDISRGMIIQASKKKAFDPILRDARIQMYQEDASATEVSSGSFDTVVSTFCLCSAPDPQAVLREMMRVVKPGGKMLLLEPSRSDNQLVAKYQDATAPAVAATSKHCVWNQDVPAMLEQAGLKPASLQRFDNGKIVMAEVQGPLLCDPSPPPDAAVATSPWSPWNDEAMWRCPSAWGAV